jgi:hypothetical protein
MIRISTRRPRGAALALALAGLVAAATPARADLTISTFPLIGSVGSWGNGTIPTFGQTFTATSPNNVLNSIQFELYNASGTPVNYRADVYAWNGTGITGPALFDSGDRSLGGAAGFQDVSVSTGGVSLTAGQQYVAFFTTLLSTNSDSNSVSWGIANDSAYAGGTFAFSGAGTFAGLSSPWETGFGYDTAFSFNFSPAVVSAPEPTTLVMGGAALACILPVWARRRLKRPPSPTD